MVRSAMSHEARTCADLMQSHPVIRVYVDHFADSPFITLNGLWEVGGSTPGNHPVTWLARRGPNSVGQVRAIRGHVIADELATWEYLLATEPEVVAVATAEIGRQIAADPIQCAMLCPSSKVVAIVVRHMAESLGVSEDEACVSLLDGALTRTAAFPDVHRESLVAQLQRAIRGIDAAEVNHAGESVSPFPGFRPWYIPKPNLALLRPTDEIDLCPSQQRTR